MLSVLAERRFPAGRVIPLASAASQGKEIRHNGSVLKVATLGPGSFEGIDIALFSAGAGISAEFAPIAAEAGAVAIDNSSAFRMDPSVPLVVPEVNAAAIRPGPGIIANPNCSTIQLVMVLKPLHDRWGVKRVIVSTYQAVTGAGRRAIRQLEAEIAGGASPEMKFPHRIAYNALPQVDIFMEDGYSREELKMRNETRKIMGDDTIALTATCVRIPALGGHSESVNIELARPYDPREVARLLGETPGVCVQDDPGRSLYPMPITARGRDEVFVGRIRRDDTVANGLNLWIVSDNLRKGAATNAVQIAECWAGLRG
jgi:aspartate-semialdehyde dehydrogenase